MVRSLCPICFDRFLDYPTEDELVDHLLKDHTKEEVWNTIKDLHWYWGVLEGVLIKDPSK